MESLIASWLSLLVLWAGFAPVYAADARRATSPARSAWQSFLPSPQARPLLTSLGLGPLTGSRLDALADVLARAEIEVGEIQALRDGAAQAERIHAMAERYAGASSLAEENLEAVVLLERLAPKHAGKLAAARQLAEWRVEEARRAWSGKEESGVVAGKYGGGAPLLAAAWPRRAIPLSRAAAVMEGRLTSGREMSEGAYRSAPPESLFAGEETRRMDTLLSRQAADPAQAMLEVIANGQDASVTEGRKVGRFGVGGLQVLGELKDPGDRVELETSKGDGTAAQFVFWRKDGEVLFDYRLVKSSRRGTRFKVRKSLAADEIAHRKEFLERKLRANARGPIVWRSGERINRPEDFREWGAEGRLAVADSPAVTVSLDERGYEIEDRGRGMGLKEVFERYLKPYGTDKPVAPSQEPARLLHRESVEHRASLGVAMVEIEGVPLEKRLNLARDIFIDLPHDTDLSEERGVVSLVPADQSINGALRGLRLLIDRLTDPTIEDPARFSLINSLAAMIREKQPALEKGMSRGDPKTATDLLWYLRHRLEKMRLLDSYRDRGAAFLPNAPRWAPLEGLSDKIVLLDEALFSPGPRDFAAAGLAELPRALTDQPAWRKLEPRTDVRFFTRSLRRDGPLVVVDESVVVVDRSLVERDEDAEVLVARIERELRRARGPAEPKKSPAWRRALMRRVVRPAILALALLGGPAAVVHGTHWRDYFSIDFNRPTGEWTEYGYGVGVEYSGHFPMDSEELAVAGLKPAHPFGAFNPSGGVDEFFIRSIKPVLTSDGLWSRAEAGWSGSNGRETGSIEVGYRIDLYVKQRLLNQADGRIEGIEVLDQEGKSLPFAYDPATDEIAVNGSARAAFVHYRIVLYDQINGISAEEALPQRELADFPRQWRAVLDPVRNASDSQKLAAIHRLMNRDFVYDYSRWYQRDSRGWSHTAQGYLDRSERIPIVCNTSSLYYYLMARYVGLPAAYVILVDSENGVFYHDLAGHAKVLVKADGVWRLIETTALMPLKVGAPRVIPDQRYIRGLPIQPPSWLRRLFSWLPSPQGSLPRWSGGTFGDKFAYVVLMLFGAGFVSVIGLGLWKIFVVQRGKTRRLRQLWPHFGWRRQRLPMAWAFWIDFGRKLSRQRTAWGDVYRWGKRAFISPENGAVGSNKGLMDQVQFAGRHMIFATDYGRVRTFDGVSKKTIDWTLKPSVPKLLPARGPRRYAVIRGRLHRIDAEAGRCEPLIDLEGWDILQIESRGGLDRFAQLHRPGWGRTAVRTLRVSGDRAEWEGPETVFETPWFSLKEKIVWASGAQVLYEFLTYGGERYMISSDGKKVLLPGPIEGVIAGKVYVRVGEERRTCDLASGRWGESELLSLSKVGEDVFLATGVRDGETRSYFCDLEGERIADAGGAPQAAVRVGDVVYYRDTATVAFLYAAGKDGGPRAISLRGSPEGQYSRACARATGLAPELFEPLDYWEKEKEILASPDRGAFRDAMDRDRRFIRKLEPGLKAAAPYRAAMMPEWSLGRLFLTVDAARATIAPDIQVRLDQLVRENIGRQAWLREALEPVSRIYRWDLGSADALVGHYLDLLAAAPEMMDGLREAALKPALGADGFRLEPLGVLDDGDDRAFRGLPAETQLYLRMLRDGAESLLRREADDAPQGPPSFALKEENESLGRLIAAARKATEEELDREGLEGFARIFSALAPEERADLSAVRGVVANQGVSAPVWIRELIQNARDAIREARRAGRSVPAQARLRSFLSEDGSRWIVSVRDGAGMKLSRLLKAMLVPEATTKTLADEVRGFLALGGGPEQKVERLLAEFFDEAARGDPALLSFLREAVSAGSSEAEIARRVAERLSERMRKGGAGFFGIGFFTVFGGADEVVVRTGADGKLREAALTPVRDEDGRLVDVRVRRLREYDDPSGARAGTEVLRVKNVTPENAGRILVENAYVHIMAGKYAGAVSDVALSINRQPFGDALETVAERGGLRSRLGPAARPRWTVDELFVQEPPAEGLALVPPEFRSALQASGWNVDFPAATAVVRTRASVQSPARYAADVAALALPAAYRLYREGLFTPPGLASYQEHRKVSPWDEPAFSKEIMGDAAAVASRRDSHELWRRYAADPRGWGQLMLAACDDKERVLREILGSELCSALDSLRVRGEPARVGPLPPEDAPGYREAVRELHAAAVGQNRALALDAETEGLARTVGRLTSFIEDPPPFVAVGADLCEAMRRCLDEGVTVPLMEAFLAAVGRGSDEAAVRLFEGWLGSQDGKKKLEKDLLSGSSKGLVRARLDQLHRAALRGRPALIPLRRPA